MTVKLRLDPSLVYPDLIYGIVKFAYVLIPGPDVR